MRKETLYYRSEGFNCSQCILKATEEYYKKSIPQTSIEMCKGINMGFGICEMCSVLIAGVMIFGLFFDDIAVKKLRLEFLDRFASAHSSMDCPMLRREAEDGTCEKIIGEIADLICEIVDREMF